MDQKQAETISVIVPCYNEEQVLPLLYQELKRVFASLPAVKGEFLFIDDGSRDHTLALLRSLHARDRRCRYLSFSRNFGKEAAMYAGLEHATGEYCVIMDADLQHPPSLLPEMYRVVKCEGYDCCAGVRQDRAGEGRLRRLLTGGYYRVLGKLCRMDVQPGAGDFRLMRRTVAQALLACPERDRYLKGLFQFVGFETKYIPFTGGARAAGQSKWGIPDLWRYALDAIFSCSTAPVGLIGTVGTVLTVLGGLGVLWQLLLGGDSLAPLLVWIGGIQLLALGLLGQYLVRDYRESRGRPHYILKAWDKDMQ